ncbi:hypothetical protein UlMin_001182 [Ulmus minor]
MFRFCYKSLPLPFQSCRNIGISPTHLLFLQIAPVFPKSLSSKTSLAAEENSNSRGLSPKRTHLDCSFLVSYLRKSWGFSPENALFVSERIKTKTLKKPEAVLRLFREYGFSETHISKILRSRPRFLLADAEKTFLPKFEFLHSIGISNPDIVLVTTRNPTLLEVSLENSIVPFYDVLKSELPAQKVAKGLSTWRLFGKEALSNFGPNISTLKEVGVPNSSIVYLLVSSHAGTIVQQNTETFKENVAKVISMGFNPSLMTFSNALQVISLLSKSRWEEKWKLYKKCGWTEDEILLAFRKSPLIMVLKEKNVVTKMSFFVNKMGLQPSDVARTPEVLKYSLGNRIIPRCSVIQVLLSKGLIKKKVPLSTILYSTDKYILETFVLKYQQEIPQLSSILEGKMSAAELGLGFEDTSRDKRIVA